MRGVSQPVPNTVLSVDHLRKEYLGVIAVDDVTFHVSRSEIVGLLGPNGAGKTSTVNMVLGVLQPTAGLIRIEGLDLATQRATALTFTNFAAAYAPLPGNLSVRQNLFFFGRIYGVSGLSQRVDELIDRFSLSHFAHTKCGLLSSGEQTRVILAKAMLNRPRLLLLDEPTASIDPSTARDIRSIICQMAADSGTGILWTSHNMAEVQQVCDRVLIMSHGQILLQGDPRQLPGEFGAASLEDLFVRVARGPFTLGNGR